MFPTCDFIPQSINLLHLFSHTVVQSTSNLISESLVCLITQPHWFKWVFSVIFVCRTTLVQCNMPQGFSTILPWVNCFLYQKDTCNFKHIATFLKNGVLYKKHNVPHVLQRTYRSPTARVADKLCFFVTGWELWVWACYCTHYLLMGFPQTSKQPLYIYTTVDYIHPILVFFFC